MAQQEEQEEQEHGTGLGERVSGGVKRAAGAIGRAARSAMGQPEAGTDLLFQTLHADHEQVSTLFAKMLSTDERNRVQELWRMLCLNLIAHSRAEQEVVYRRLERQPEMKERIGHSFEEHADIERLIRECEAQGVGSEEFYGMATELEQVVRHHVDEEESEVLPKARKLLAEEESDRLVMQFQERKVEIVPDIREEIGIAGRPQGSQRKQQQRTQGSQQKSRSQQRGRSASGSQDRGAERRRSAQRSGQKSSASRGRGRGKEDLNEMTLSQLREMASQKEIPGRSRMDKRELVNALRRA